MTEDARAPRASQLLWRRIWSKISAVDLVHMTSTQWALFWLIWVPLAVVALVLVHWLRSVL